jgi:hypothetical protein
MDTFDDLEDMALPGLDATLAEWLITGAVDPSDAPAGFDRVAALIKRAQEPATENELAARAVTVTAFAAKARACPVVRARNKRILPFQTFPAKVLAVATPFVLLGGGVATATGSLPAPAQAAVSRVLSSLGISVPNAQNGSQGTAGLPSSSTGGAAPAGTALGTAPGNGSTTPSNGATTSVNGVTASENGANGAANGAIVGLCSAWKAGELNHHDSAYPTLVASAGGARNLAVYCRGVLTSPPPSRPTGHVKNLSAGQPESGPAASTASTTGKHGGAVHRGGSKPDAIAMPRSSVVTRGSSVPAGLKAAPTSLRGHRPEVQGTSRLAAAPSASPVAAGPLVHRATKALRTASGHARGHGRSTKAGSPVPKLPTQVTPTTPSVSAPPVSASVQIGHGAHGHHGQTGLPRRQRGCSDSARPGHGAQAHAHCHAVTSNGTSSNASSVKSGPPASRRPHRTPKGVAKPHSVKHRSTM